MPNDSTKREVEIDAVVRLRWLCIPCGFTAPLNASCPGCRLTRDEVHHASPREARP